MCESTCQSGSRRDGQVTEVKVSMTLTGHKGENSVQDIRR